MRKTQPDYPNLKEAILAADYQTASTLVNEFVYNDDDGLEAFRVLDYQSEDDGRRQTRTIWPVSLSEDGWCIGDPPRPWPLYRLPEMTPFQRVYVCQDERGAEAARSMGLIATTFAHGCFCVDKTDWSPLAGRDVVLLPSNDQAGRVFVRRVTAILARLLPPAEVRVLQLPGLGEHAGVWEFQLQRHPRPLQQIGQDIDEMADALPEYWLIGYRLPPEPTRLDNITPARVQWLWPGRIALGKLNLLYASTAWGESLLGIDIAARVSRGAPWPDGSGLSPRGSVIFLNYDDILADTIRPELEKAGADLTRIFAPGQTARSQSGRPRLTAISSLHWAIDRALVNGPGGWGDGTPVKLVLIEPMSWHLSGNAKAALSALANLAAERGLAVLMVIPLCMQPNSLRRLRASGRLDLPGVRTAWLAVPDAAESERRLLLPLKSTLVDTEPTGLAFRIKQGHLEWEKEPVNLNASDLLLTHRKQKRRGPPPAKRAIAEQWLRDRLAAGAAYVGHPNAREPGSLRSESREAGLSWSTVRRAFGTIGAVSERCRETGRYWWRHCEQQIIIAKS